MKTSLQGLKSPSVRKPAPRGAAVRVGGRGRLFPEDLLTTRQERHRADGILLTDITAYRSYKPMVIGVRSKLFRVEDMAVLWACDEMIDAGRSTVSTGARRYARSNVKQDYPMRSGGSILQSPSRFASYTANLIYETLPPRH